MINNLNFPVCWIKYQIQKILSKNYIVYLTFYSFWSVFIRNNDILICWLFGNKFHPLLSTKNTCWSICNQCTNYYFVKMQNLKYFDIIILGWTNNIEIVIQIKLITGWLTKYYVFIINFCNNNPLYLIHQRSCVKIFAIDSGLMLFLCWCEW